jgi:hypothetical protein
VKKAPAGRLVERDDAQALPEPPDELRVAMTGLPARRVAVGLRVLAELLAS